MQPIDFNLELAASMLEQFDSYLLSKEAFWPLGGRAETGGIFPKLSLGQLALTLDELKVQAEEMSPREIQQYQSLVGTFEEKRRQRPANLEKKAVAEIRQRLNLWKAYVADLRASTTAAESYANDVRQRVLLQRLQRHLREGERLEGLHSELTALDGRLHALFRPGAFVWHPRLRPLYDQHDFWYLFGEPIPQPQ